MMSFLKVSVAAICLLAMLTALESKDIPKSEQQDEVKSWKEKLMPRFSINKNAQAKATGPKHTARKSGVNPRSLDTVPVNVAVYSGQNVTLICAATPGSGYSIQWWEFVYSEDGNAISNGDTIMESHPEAERYAIHQPTADTFNLHIRDVKWEDAGVYSCEDVFGGGSGTYNAGLELIVIDDTPNCTTTLSSNGIVIEGQYYTAECIFSYNGNIDPLQTWTGPEPFNGGGSIGDDSIWSGISWIADRSMDTKAFQCINNFTENFIPDEEMSPYVPDWFFIYQTNQMFVYWGPTNMYAEPIKDFYEVGDILTCYADAFPAASYFWQNTRTTEIFRSQGIIINETLVGTSQLMRCQAQNLIQGFVYSDNIFVNVTVLAPTTPAPEVTTPLPPTPTTPPAVGVCSDLSGRWESTEEIRASLCLSVDNTANGFTIGILRNDTDTFWIEVVGRTQPGNYDLIGFTGIWPPPVGVSGFVGECHRCDGVEVLLVNDIERLKGSQECGSPDFIRYSPQYRFYRSGPSCVSLL